jgi:hypothetical protein
MNWTGRARLWGCAVTILALAACGTGPAPNDVTEGVGFQDYQEYQARRAALRNAPPAAAQTALPPADVVAEPFATQPRGASQWTNATSTQPRGSVDVARVAAGAIAEAEQGITPAAAPNPPAQIATAPTGDDFVAPPLPEGMAVLGANVVAFALSTQHAVGERVYPRNPLRLGGREVRCSDFRTTDLAQDWFLTNGGPDRDRSRLDPDGDGFACNWSPERYRAEAREASRPVPPQPFGTLQEG